MRLAPKVLLLAVCAMASPAAAQDGWQTFGSGCPGRLGAAALGASDGARLGARWGVTARPVPDGAVSWLWVSASRTRWSGGALPQALGPFGMPGCTLEVAPIFGVRPWETRAQRSAFDVLLPMSPGMVGRQLFLQCVHAEPGANPAGLVWSNAAAATVQGPNERVRVLSYNIHHGRGIDGRIDLPRIARVLRDSDADVVMIQELDRGVWRSQRVDQFAELVRLTGMNGVFGKAFVYQGGDFGNAVFSQWPVISQRVHRLPNPQRSEPRVVLDVGLQRPSGGTLRVLATHFDPIGEPTLTLSAQVIESLVAGTSAPTVFGGDLNAPPHSAVIQRLRRTFLDGSAGRRHATVPSTWPTGQLDYVMAHPRLALRALRTDVLNEPVASDHRPIATDWEWR